MNTKEQWEYEFDKLFVEQGNHRGGKIVREEASKIIDFIRETREQAKKEERDKILETLWNTPSSMIPEALQRISKQ